MAPDQPGSARGGRKEPLSRGEVEMLDRTAVGGPDGPD